MMLLSNSIANMPVFSLRLSGQIATTLSPIINPNNLKVEGFYVQPQNTRSTPVLLSQDIRELMPRGIVIDDLDVLSEPEELIRLKQILEIDFELLGKKVVTVKGKKLGRTSDFALNTENFMIDKIYVSPSVIKSLAKDSLAISRSMIVEINDRRIIVKDLQATSRSRVNLLASATT